MKNFCLKTVLLLLLLNFSVEYGSIDPYIPTKVSVLNQGISAIYTFNLQFNTAISFNNYLMINFTNYTSSISAKSCFYSIYPNFPSTQTTCTVPNSDNILFLLVPIAIATTNIYTFVIELANANPIGSLSSGLELKTVSSTDVDTFFVYDYNPNYESIPFNSSITNQLIAYLNGFDDSTNYNVPNEIVGIQIGVKINVDLFENPRIKLILTSPWNFQTTNTLSVSNDPKYIALSDSDTTKSEYKAPDLLNYQIESPLEAYIVLNENLSKGRSFLINIKNFVNPSIYSQIFLKLYTMKYNSNSAIEFSENSVVLQTLQNPLIVSLGLASKISLISNSAASFYKASLQYIQVNISSSQATPDNSFVTITIGVTNQIIKGSVSLTGFSASSGSGSSGLTLSYSANTLIISGVKSIIANTIVSVTMRIRTTSVDSSIFAYVSFDKSSSATTPAFSGMSNPYYFHSNGYTIISNFVLSMNPTNTFIFTITPSVDDTSLNSFLEIYFSKFIKFSGNPTCLITAPVSTTISNCPLTDKGTYYYLKLISPVGQNMFPSTGITVSIGGFTLTDCSNHQDKIYEFYLQLNSDNSASPAKLFLMIAALALPTMNTLPNFYQSFSNDLYWTSLNYNYPSMINLLGTALDFTAITIASGSQRIITLFAQKSFKNLFGSNLISNSSFPCGSNIQITCFYIEGDSQTYVSSSTYFLDWDRVNIYLPNTIPTDFHIILPDIFYSGTTYVYQIYTGTVSSTSQFSYLYIEPQLSVTPLKVLSNTYLQTNLQIQNSGFATAEINNFQLKLYTSLSHLGNVSPNFGASLFIITDWELWVSGTSSSSGTAFGTLQNSAVNFNFIGGDNLHYYVLYIPLTNVANLNAGLTSYLNGVFNPFSLDLPNYVIYITNKLGAFDTYNSFFNAGTNSYTSNILKDLSFNCIDLKEGEINTFCTLTFQTNNRIAANGNLMLKAVGLTFHTNTCFLSSVTSSVTNALTGFTCAIISSAKDVLNVALSLNSALSNINVNYFNLSFWGVDINTNGEGSILLDFSVRDFSSNYIMENMTRSFPVLQNLLRFHTISSITLEYYNPSAITRMNITVIFPRDLYPNENIMLDIGNDLLEKNQNIDELQVFFYNYATLYTYSISVVFSQSLITLTLNNQDYIKAGTYVFKINGIKLPSTTPQSNLAVNFLRTFDNIITLSSYDNSTTSFPELQGNDKPNIQILQAKYMLEGHVGEYIFGVTILSSSLDYTTIIYVNFPEYLSPSLYTDASLLYCGIGNLEVSCQADPSFSYRLQLTNFPTFLYAGSTFNITVYGIINPKYSNSISNKYINSSIIFGVDQLKNGSYSEIANLPPPNILPLPNPFMYLQLVDVFVDNLVVKDLATHIFELILDGQAIVANSGYLINFGSEYSSLENLDTIKCQINYINSFGFNILASDSSLCEVRGKRIKGYFNNYIPANTNFNISLKNVPTPQSLVTIDPNKILISIFDSTEIQVISYTKVQTNSAKTYSFLDKTMDIQVNNGSQIVLTQGTYSPIISIMPNNGLRFVNNLMLNASLDGFEFYPSSLLIMLGDFSSNFQIGVDRDLLNGVYSFAFQKKELGFQNLYQNLATIYLFLTTNPIQIEIPDQLNVNYYGCNLPYLINLTYPPFSDIILNFLLDYDTFGETFYVDDQLNSYASVFLQNNTISNLAFCTSETIDLTITSTIVSLSLTGINSNSYYLSRSQINIIFQKKTRVIQPLANSSINFIGKNGVSIKIDVNCDGLLFWRLALKTYNIRNLTSLEIREYIQKSNFTERKNESNNFEDGPYEIYNYMIVYNNSIDPTVNNTLIIDGLMPAKEYEIFGYSRNEFRDMSSNFTYLKFTTQSLQNLTKIIAIFNRTIYEDEINNFYCYLVREFQTKSKLIVSSDGRSCSFYFSPISYYYQYAGQSFSVSSNRTNLYFIPDPELEHDTALEKIDEYFDPNTFLVSNEVLSSGESYGVDFIESMIFENQFNQTLLYNAQTPFKIPSIVNVSFGVYNSKYNSSILVNNLTLDGDGAVYFIMEPYEKTLEDSDFPGEYYNQTIRTYQPPTGDQIKNCQNYLNKTAEVCFRAFFYNKTSLDIEIRLVESYTVYKVYYMIANENPIFPVYNSSQVYETEALSYTIYGVRMAFFKAFIMLLTGGILLILI